MKRRNLSGIYIFDKFPGEDHQVSTCIEDCQTKTLENWISNNKNLYWLDSVEKRLLNTFSQMMNCIADSTDKEGIELITNEMHKYLNEINTTIQDELERYHNRILFLCRYIHDFADLFDIINTED